MFSLVVVPLYTTLVSVHSGSSQSRRVLCSPWSLCLSTPPLCLSTVGRHRAGVCYVLHVRWASLHHPCVCLQWVVTEQACAMFSMVAVPLYTTLVSVCSGSSQSKRVLCSPCSLCLSTPLLCLSAVGRHRVGVCYVLHGRCASLHHPCVCLQWVVTEQACAMFSMVAVPLYTTLVSVYSGSLQSRRVLCSPWSLCLSTPPLCLSRVGRYRASVCYVLHGRCASLHHPCVWLQWVVTEQACAMFSMVVVPLYTTLVSVYPGSSQSKRVLCSPWSLCLSTPPLCLSKVGRHRAGVCYVLHGRCASLHHPCVCLQWVVTEQACAMFSMVVVPLYTTLVSVYSGSSQSRRVLCSPWSLCLSTPPLCLSTVGRYRAGVCYILHCRCASLHHPCVCLQWVVTEQACAMFSIVAVSLYTTLVSVYSGSLQSRRVLYSPLSLCLSTSPLCLSTVGRHRAGVCYVLHCRCVSLHHPCVCLQWVVTEQACAMFSMVAVPLYTTLGIDAMRNIVITSKLIATHHQLKHLAQIIIIRS